MNKSLRGTVWEMTEGHCAYCGKELKPFGNWNIDHVVPKKRGGNDSLNNLVPSCYSCNQRKKSKNANEFRAWLIQSSLESIEHIRKKLACAYCITQVSGDDLGGAIEEMLIDLAVNIKNSHITFYGETLLQESGKFIKNFELGKEGKKEGENVQSTVV